MVLDIIFSIDKSVSTIIEKLQYEPIVSAFKFYTFFGSKDFMIVFFIIFCLFLLFKQKYKDMLFFISSISLSALITVGLKNIIQRSRPENILVYEESFSFPSSHSSMSFALAFSIYFIYRQTLTRLQRYLLFLYAFFICFSRIYLNAHYLSDVLVGASVGIVSVIMIRKKFETKV